MGISKVQIHHVLHGYNNGHSLIASSIDLDINEKKLLLIMSDMSGSSMENGFEEYITGYPLNNINSYAFAKTWHAPEMKRPGCVWTHTLLIKFSDLINIYHYTDIINLFKKPIEFVDYDYYRKPLILNEGQLNNITEEINNHIDCYISKNLLYHIYKYPDKSILFKSLSPINYETLVTSIWLQQWPRLRRNFYFCTGAISPRVLEDKVFDFQIVPDKLDNNAKNNSSYIIIDENIPKENILEEDWINDASNDLLHSTNLRYYLNNFGADVSESRSSFIPLVKLFIFFTNKNINKNLFDILKILSDNFPKPSEANSLKMYFLNNPNKNLYNNFDIFIPYYSEEEILFELSISNHIKSFNLKKLNIEERIYKLLEKDPENTFRLLSKIITLEINNCGIEMLKLVSKKINSEHIKYLNREYRKLLLTFLLFNPDISYEKIFWDVKNDEQIENYMTLYNNRNNLEINWQIIINILLDNDSAVVPELFFNNNEFNFDYLFSWLNSNIDKKLNNEWFNLLKIKPLEILNWLNNNFEQVNSNTINIFLSILNPNSRDVLNYGTNLWLNLISEFNNSDYSRDSLFCSFVLSVAFNNPDSNSFKLLSPSFEIIYKIAMDDKLEYSNWKHLEVHTKQLFKWNEWDKCKKLRKALVDKYLEYQWPINKFGGIFNNRFVIEHLLKYYKNSQKYFPFKTELRKRLESL